LSFLFVDSLFPFVHRVVFLFPPFFSPVMSPFPSLPGMVAVPCFPSYLNVLQLFAVHSNLPFSWCLQSKKPVLSLNLSSFSEEPLLPLFMKGPNFSRLVAPFFLSLESQQVMRSCLPHPCRGFLCFLLPHKGTFSPPHIFFFFFLTGEDLVVFLLLFWFDCLITCY